MSEATGRGHRGAHRGALLVAMAVVIAMLTWSPAPARAAEDCAGPFTVAVSGPEGTGSDQPLGSPVTLTLLGGNGNPVGLCNDGTTEYEFDWTGGGTGSNPHTVTGTALGPATYMLKVVQPAPLECDPDLGGHCRIVGDPTTVDTESVTLSYDDPGPARVQLFNEDGFPRLPGLAVRWDVAASGPLAMAGYSVDWGDGSSTTDAFNPGYTGGDGTDAVAGLQHTWRSAGDYTVTSTVTDVQGKSRSHQDPVHVLLPPTASFTAPATVDFGNSVHLDAGASTTDPAGTATYAWDFGDGRTATGGSTTSYPYRAPGRYTITLTVTDKYGRTAQTTRDVDYALVPTPVDAPPVASWTGTPATPTAGDLVSFDGTASSDSDGSVRDYSWTFGDNTSATGASAQHRFAHAGSYAVTLTVTDNGGATNSLTRTVQVSGALPRAAFSATPTSPTAGAPTTFDGSGSTDADGSVAGFAWDFGDETSGAGGPTSTHTYQHAGIYDVVLTVTDDDGNTASATHTVTVTPAAPAASFTAPSAVAVTPASFDGSASSDVDGTITDWAWDFGDGVPVHGRTPTHTFLHPGVVPVTLTVTDDAGLTGAVTHTVTVDGAPPMPVFSTPTASAGVPVAFDGAGSSDPDGSVVGYHWEFGDGTPGADGATPTHSFQSAGSYPVTLTVTDDSGLTGSVTHLVAAVPAAVKTPGMAATDLAVSIAGKSPKAGQYAYTVTVKNLGHAAAQNVVLLDTPDTTQTLVRLSAPAALTCSGVPIGATGTITCKSGTSTLAPGKSWVLTVTVRQPAALRTVRTLVDTAQVRAANPDGVAKNNTARLTTVLAAAR